MNVTLQLQTYNMNVTLEKQNCDMYLEAYDMNVTLEL